MQNENERARGRYFVRFVIVVLTVVGVERARPFLHPETQRSTAIVVSSMVTTIAIHLLWAQKTWPGALYSAFFTQASMPQLLAAVSLFARDVAARFAVFGRDVLGDLVLMLERLIGA